MKISNWVNLDKILGANAGEGQRMTQDVFGGLEQEGMDARANLAKSRRIYEAKVRNTARDAFSGLDLKTAAGAEAAGQRTYTGPRSLSEYDPGIGDQIGDAARRMGGTLQQQYAARYGTRGSAMGSAVDRALMGGAGVQQSEALRNKAKTLREDFSAAQAESDALAANADAGVREEALRLAGLAPGMRQDEARRARLKREAELYARNLERRRKYDEEWAARNRRFNNTRGNQLQASYQPPEAEVLPYYQEE